jgi:ubiquitin-activating enzyme E1
LLCLRFHLHHHRSGAKKPPTPLDFNASDELHVEFVLATANLRATMYGVPACPDLQTAAAIAATVVVEKFRCVSSLG